MFHLLSIRRHPDKSLSVRKGPLHFYDENADHGGADQDDADHDDANHSEGGAITMTDHGSVLLTT